MKESSFKQAVSPWTIVLLFVFALIIFIPAVGEYFAGKRDLLELWHQQGGLLSETILRSADRISGFDRQTEKVNRDRLLDLGRYIRQIDSLNYPNNRPVRQYARREGQVIPILINMKGEINLPRRSQNFPSGIQNLEQFIKSSPPVEDVSFLPEDYFNHPEKPGVIIKRTQQHGYIILIPAPRMGRMAGQEQRHLKGWMEHLAAHASIEYIILQRENKIMASSGPAPTSVQTSHSVQPFWIIRELADKRFFEYAQTGPAGLRVIIGLPTTALENLQNSLIRRLLINSLILLLLGSVLLIYLLKKQNLGFLQSRYAHIQTYNTSVLENIDEGIIVLDQDQTISVINKAAASLLNISEEQTIGKNITSMNTPLPAEVIISFSQFKPFSEIPVQIQNIKKRYDLLISAQPVQIKDSEQNQQIYIILLRNNTTQRELENFRNRRSKLTAMGELASRVAHEIRNPLNGIAMLAQRIQKEFAPSEDKSEFQKMTQSIRNESNRINEIVEAFLYYARSPELKLQNIQIKSWLEDALPIIEALGNVKIGPLSPITDTVQMDSDQIKQALINLVINAVESSPDNEQVNISLTGGDGEAVIKIDDKGAGIPEDKRDQVFDLYFSTKELGSGLGLSIVEKIVSAHGGKVRFESPYLSEGKTVQGTRFEIILPVADKNESI